MGTPVTGDDDEAVDGESTGDDETMTGRWEPGVSVVLVIKSKELSERVLYNPQQSLCGGETEESNTRLVN